MLSLKARPFGWQIKTVDGFAVVLLLHKAYMHLASLRLKSYCSAWAAAAKHNPSGVKSVNMEEFKCN